MMGTDDASRICKRLRRPKPVACALKRGHLALRPRGQRRHWLALHPERPMTQVAGRPGKEHTNRCFTGQRRPSYIGFVAQENLRPLIEDLDKKVDHLIEVVSLLTQHVADFREETIERFDRVDERLEVIEASVRGHSKRLTAVESRVDRLEAA
jgi:hypothetical protein